MSKQDFTAVVGLGGAHFEFLCEGLQFLLWIHLRIISSIN